MKKMLAITMFFVLLFSIVTLCFTTSAIAEPWRVFDNAGLFSSEDVNTIEQAIFEFQCNTNIDFAVLTTDDYIGKENWKTIADSFYDSENFGFGHQASGMLYYIDMNQRIPYISTCGEMIQVFDSFALTEAHDICHSFLASGQYKDAVLQMIEFATKEVETHKKDAV